MRIHDRSWDEWRGQRPLSQTTRIDGALFEPRQRRESVISTHRAVRVPALIEDSVDVLVGRVRD